MSEKMDELEFFEREKARMQNLSEDMRSKE